MSLDGNGDGVVLPPVLIPLLQRRDFWLRFFWDRDDHEYPELEGCEVVVPLGDEAALVLDLDELLAYFSLSLRHPSLPEPVELGWDDQAHWHPHVLRWEELDLLGRWAALSHPELTHPGVLVALLHRFTPLCRGDDEAVVPALLEAAYRSLGVFRGKALQERVDRYDRREAGFTWRQDPACGWVLEQDEAAPEAGDHVLYTRRNGAYPHLPFQLWNEQMARLQEAYRHAADPAWLEAHGGRAGELARTIADRGDLARLPDLARALEEAGCNHSAILVGLRRKAGPVAAYWLLELLLGEAPGTLIRKHCGRKRRRPRVIHRFEITYPGFPVRPREVPDRTLLALVADLDRKVRQELSGRAEIVGRNAAYAPNRRTLTEEAFIIHCQAVDDAEAAIHLIRAVLQEHGLPEGTRLRQMSREEREIPLMTDTTAPGGTT